MSSWTSLNSPKPIRLGYRQILPEGKFIKKEKPATVVSAYYEMPSKNKKEDYRNWIRIFLETIPCFLVFFTEEPLVPFIKECRKNFEDRTVIIALPRSEWNVNKQFKQEEFDALFKLDPEKHVGHTPELYKVWYEKKEFVLRAISLNPFNHTDFVWTDAGIYRDQKLAELTKAFPVADRIPTDRIMMLNVMAFTKSDEVLQNGFIGGGVDKARIGGGIVAASKEQWIVYNTLFNSIIERYRKAGLFWGKEQTIMKTLVLENKTKVSLIEAKPIMSNYWFYSVLYLGASPKIFGLLISEKTNQQKRDYDYLLNVMN